MFNGGPLAIDWLKNATMAPPASPGHVDAVVEGFELGQSAGTAFADVLWGDVSSPCYG